MEVEAGRNERKGKKISSKQTCVETIIGSMLKALITFILSYIPQKSTRKGSWS